MQPLDSGPAKKRPHCLTGLLSALCALTILVGNGPAAAQSITDASATSWTGPIIDVHSQIDEDIDLSTLIPMLDEAGVSLVMLSTRFEQDSSVVTGFAADHPTRIIPAAKTKTKAFMRGRGNAGKLFAAEWQSYPYGAMAEVILWHAAKKKVGAGEAIIEPDDPRLTPLLQAARERGIPFIPHIEFAAMGWDKSAYMEKFEGLLAANRDLPMGLIHMGQLDAAEAARLLPLHPNLFFITSHSNPVTLSQSNLPWTQLIAGERFAPAWQPLIEQFPDRFVLAFDNVFSFQWRDTFLPQAALWRKVLASVPDDIAQQIAHGNAERLWKLPSAVTPGSSR